MQDTLPTSASSKGAHSDEDELLSELERVLDEPPAAGTLDVGVTGRRFGRYASLARLAAVGAALALMPGGVKDALTTGRSVAHSPDR